MRGINLYISNFELREAWRLFLRFLLFVPILAFVAFINTSIDPLNVYAKTVNKGQRNEYFIAQTLLEGKNVELLREGKDDRLIQKHFVENLAVAPDIAILGSSHSMWLGDNIFLNKKVINNSVLGVALPDYLGIFEGYVKRKSYPKKVICVLDPQLVIFPITSEKWVSIKEDVYRMLERIGARTEKIKPLIVPQELRYIFSFSYFQKSLDNIQDKRSVFEYRVTEDVTGNYLMFKDGRTLLGFFLDNEEKNRKKTLRELYHGKYVQSLNQKKPDKELGDVLEQFIRYLMGRQVEVTLCLLPLHPELYASFHAPQKGLKAIDIDSFEQYYRNLAKRLNLEIIGSYNPLVCNLKANDFYDVDHIKNDVIERMLKQAGATCSMPGI